MTTFVMPKRQWGPKEPLAEATPTILVSSRDDAPVPHVAGAVKLAKAAADHGWAVQLTFALASVPDRFYLNGNLAKAAHQLASVAVRLARGVERGWAVWHRVDQGAWRFADAFIGLSRFGAKSILDGLATHA